MLIRIISPNKPNQVTRNGGPVAQKMQYFFASIDRTYMLIDTGDYDESENETDIENDFKCHTTAFCSVYPSQKNNLVI